MTFQKTNEAKNKIYIKISGKFISIANTTNMMSNLIMIEDYDLTAIIGKLELLKRNLQQQKSFY